MAIVYKNKEYRNLQEQVLENAKNIAILQEKPGLQPVIVDELPETGEVGILYLVPSEDPETENAYDEYVWVEEENAFEMVGSTAIDLSHLPSPVYVTTATKPEGLSYGLRIKNNGWTSDIQQEGGAKIELTGSLVKMGNIEVDGETTMKATADSAANIWKFRPVNDYNLYVARDGSDRFLFQSNMFAPATYQNPSINLGSANYTWEDLYLDGQIHLGVNATITKDSSNRLNLNNGGVARIKVGGVDSTYCVANWNPDVDGTYNLGKSTMRWLGVYTTKVSNDSGKLRLKGNPGIIVDLTAGGAIQPSANNSYTIGTSSSRFNTVYTTTISNGTDSVAVADIAKKPNYSNPEVFASGTLDTNGEGTIDMTVTGMPADGLYMFTYGNAQCFIALTSTMIQNAGTYPMRCPCPLLFNGSGYPGNLKISRSGDVLTLKVAAPNVGVVAPDGYGWQLIKVM